MQPCKIKNYADCYQYSKGGYEKRIYKFFIESKILDKSSEAFEDIKFSIKKMAPSPCVADALESPNVILLYHPEPLTRAFKVFTAKDLKSGDNKLKVFIDISDIISTAKGSIAIDVKNIDKLVSFLTSAVTLLIYYSHPEKLINNSKLMKCGTECFAELFSYVIDWLRVSGIERMKEKCMYMSSLYFHMSIMGREYSKSVETLSKSISKISLKDIEILDIMLPSDTYNGIDTFIPAVAKVINSDGLRLDNFIMKWTTLFGSGTHFGVEYFPAFSSIITNVYNGSYLVTGQKVVEKVCGRSIVEYASTLLSIGNELRI